MDLGAVSKILLLVSTVGSLILFAHPRSRASGILSHLFGPIPRNGELRSDHLLGVSAYSAIWLVALLGVCSLTYILATDYGIKFKQEEANLLVLLALACFVAMAILGAIGSIFWSMAIRLFGRDDMYLIEVSDVSDDAQYPPKDSAR